MKSTVRSSKTQIFQPPTIIGIVSEPLGCLKATYNSESEANRFQMTQPQRRTRAYRCGMCGKWHLTSKERWRDRRISY